MFQYNRFWHFWFQLNSWNYFSSFLVAIVISLLLIPAAIVFPPLAGLIAITPLLGLIAVTSLVIGGAITLFTQLSNFFYSRQNQQLMQLKSETSDVTLKNDIDLYLNRRVICPQELLAGTHLNLPHDTLKMKKAAAIAPFILATEDSLTINKIVQLIPQRNTASKAMSQSNQLYVKNVAAKDGLSEIAAREMAEILGFSGLIPSNTLAKTDVLRDIPDGTVIPNEGLILSRQRVKKLITQRQTESSEKTIKNTSGVQNAVAKFVFNLKTAAYRTKAQKEEQFKLLHIQKLMPNSVDGLTWYTWLFNEPAVEPGQFVWGGLSESIKRNQRDQAKKILQNINIRSFQENFLLQFSLGSEDENPGNTLFTDAPNGTVILHSIDHERMMPEDNYNITKKIPVGAQKAVERDIENVFPIRLWLAGLPQAKVPFTKEVMEKVLESFNPQRLLAYHRQKKLFSPAAVGAQLDRILLVKKVFEEEIKKPKITLTPQELFLKLINNHPTYLYLKKELQLSELHQFIQLGFNPEGADISFFRHPLNWFPMQVAAGKVVVNAKQGLPPFSEESFESSHTRHFLFFSIAYNLKNTEKANKAGLDILAETSQKLGLQ